MTIILTMCNQVTSIAAGFVFPYTASEKRLSGERQALLYVQTFIRLYLLVSIVYGNSQKQNKQTNKNKKTTTTTKKTKKTNKKKKTKKDISESPGVFALPLPERGAPPPEP